MMIELIEDVYINKNHIVKIIKLPNTIILVLTVGEAREYPKKALTQQFRNYLDNL